VSLNPFKNRKLLKNGARGTATVLELDEKALRRHQIESTERVNLKLKLRVDVDGIEPYETEGQFWVHTSRLTGPGQELPVAVDPKKPKKLAIDWNQPPAGIGGGTGGVEIDLG
jgi:hypothetical protein